MDFLQEYEEGKKGGGKHTTPSVTPTLLKRSVEAAPHVFNAPAAESMVVYPGQMSTAINHTVEELYAPQAGPVNPYAKSQIRNANSSSIVGVVQPEHIDDMSFDEQYHTFMNYGYAMNPSGHGFVGDHHAHQLYKGATVLNARKDAHSEIRKRKHEERARELPSAEAALAKNVGDLKETPAPLEESAKGTAAAEAKAGAAEGGGKEEAKEEAKEGGDKKRRKAAGILLDMLRPEDCKTKFHGASEVDYQGRVWTEKPPGVRPSDGHTCYYPKKCIHTFNGHTKGVQSIQFFPKTGHLLLSAAMDGRCKVWQGVGDHRIMRTYMGHTQAVRQAKFSASGSEFLSTSYDKTVKLWDVETGKCKNSFTNDRVAYCVAWAPRDPNVFLCGSQNKRIVQWDARANEVVLEYDYHLGPVNTVTFVEDGIRFASTSDDKKMLVWEYNTPVPVKYISEPTMHSMPYVEVSPDGEFVACQSLDNQILMYNNKFRQHRKKVFKGHVVAGYACQIAFSPDMKFIASGDGVGQLWIWDWKTRRVQQKLKCHRAGPCIGAVWHPTQPSQVATCGWDGVIKLWE